MPSYKVIVKDVFCNCEPKNVCILMDTDKKYQDLKLYHMQQSNEACFIPPGIISS